MRNSKLKKGKKMKANTKPNMPSGITIKKERVLISKEEWIIRLMQGMVGNYGNPNTDAECYYHNGKFIIDYKMEQSFYLNLNDIRPDRDFWIRNKKGIPIEPVNIININ